jgi:hypothetical protein
VAGWFQEGGVPQEHVVTGELRRLHNEVLYDLFCSQNCSGGYIGKTRWVGNVVGKGGRRGAYRVLMGKLWRERDRLENVGVDGLG